MMIWVLNIDYYFTFSRANCTGVNSGLPLLVLFYTEFKTKINKQSEKCKNVEKFHSAYQFYLENAPVVLFYVDLKFRLDPNCKFPG